MDKRKIDMSNYADMHEEKTIIGKDGTEVAVRDHISYEEKEAMAREIVENTAVIHDDSCVYMSSEFDRFKMYAIAKYYTDIDIDGVSEYNVADFLINDGLITQIEDIIKDDLTKAMDIQWNMYDALSETYHDDKSLTKALRTSFAFLFNGEDIMDSIAKAEAAKNAVYGAINAWQKKEKEEEENIDNGTLKVGGNVINFAKKE